MRALLASALLFLGPLAHAAVVEVQSFSEVNGATDPELFGCLEVGTDANIGPVDGTSGTKLFSTTNGGHDSLRWSLRSSVANGSGNVGFCRRATTGGLPALNLTRGSIRRCIHFATVPSSGTRPFLGALEGTGSSNEDVGCYVEVNSNRALVLKYGAPSPVTVGTTANNVVRALGCTNNPWVGCAAGSDCPKICSTTTTRICVDNGDCPGGETCGADTCTKDHFACVDMGFAVNGLTSVTCELRVNGVTYFAGTPQTVNPKSARTVVDVFDGAPSSTSFGGSNGMGTGALTAYIAAGKITDTIPAGPGYPIVLGPTTGGLLQQWNDASCGSSFDVDCVKDFAVSTYRYSTGDTANQNITTASAAKQEDMAAFTTGAVRGDEKIVGAQMVAFGLTNPTDNVLRTMSQQVLYCPSGATSCVPATDPVSLVVTSSTESSIDAPRALMAPVYFPAPLQAQGWTGIKDVLGWRVRSGPDNAGRIRIGAVMLMLDVERPGESLPQNIPNNDLGWNDTKRICWAPGNSIAGGTLEGECSDGSGSCSVDNACNWNTEKDFLCTSDLDCQTCANRRSDFGGLGFPCQADAECNLGTCTASGCDPGLTNCCTNALSVPCTVSGDCDLGACHAPGGTGRTDGQPGTCVDICPAGDCLNERVGWPGGMDGETACDVLVQCPKGGEDSGQMVTNRAQDLIRGRFSNGTFSLCPGGQFLAGSGQCECTSNAECQTSSGGACTKKCRGSGNSCTSDGDCTGEGAGACLGLCTASDASRHECTSETMCAANRACVAEPDVLVIENSANDQMLAANPAGTGEQNYPDPDCERPRAVGAGTTQPPKWCPAITAGLDPTTDYGCPPTYCSTDADGSFAGKCFGAIKGTGTPVCMVNNVVSQCTAYAPACGEDKDCTASGASTPMTCEGEVASLPDYPIGYCSCDADTDCPTGYWCIANGSEPSICRLSCENAQSSVCSPAGASCVSNGAKDYCQGKKACPCRAISCTTDADCGGTTLTSRFGGFRTRFLQGTCNTALGKCDNCGAVTCSVEDAWEGPCSCDSNDDCDPGGTCNTTTKLCSASSDPAKLACRVDGECASGHRCMSAWKQVQRGYLQGHHFPPMLAEAVRRFDAKITEQAALFPNADGDPFTLWLEPAFPGGPTATGGFIPDAACGNSNFLLDVDYYRLAGQAMSRILPPHRYISLSTPTGFNQRRMVEALHGLDAIHLAVPGSDSVGGAAGGGVNKLDVCINDATREPQLYCQNADGTYQANTPCTTTCATGRCVRRVCEGQDSNCPAPGDSCGAARVEAASWTNGACATGWCDNGRGACATDADCSGGTCEIERAQRYCREGNGNWPASPATCSTAADCTAGQTCDPRPCKCTCSGNDDCARNFSSAYTCQSGECKVGSFSGCVVYNGSATCNLGTGKCELAGADMCPATFDVCNVP